MRTKQLLTKSLLLVAGLLMGATSVWAGTTTLLNIDYSTVTTPAWTVVGGNGSITDGAWVHAQGGGTGNRSAYLDFGIASSIDDKWTVEFDATLKPGNNKNDQQITVAGANTTYATNTSATGYMYFAVKQESVNGTTYTVKIGNADVATGVTLANGTKYHFKVEYDGTSAVTAYIGETEYTGTAEIANVGKLRGLHSCVARYNGQATFDNIVVTKEVDQEVVTTPTISVAYTGAKRTVTIIEGESSESNTVTTYYTTDGTDPTAESTKYTGSIVADADCTIKAITISSAGTSSEIASVNVTVGVLTLNAPSLTKAAYADGKYTVNISNSQTNLAYPPASVTTYYRIGTTGDYTAGESVSVPAGETLYAYIAADNYTSSEIITCATAVRPGLSQTWIQDYTQETSGAGTGPLGVVLTTTEGGDFTVGETPFYNIAGYTYNSATVSTSLNTNVGLNTAENFSLRCNGNNSGILQNKKDQYIGIQNLNIGDYIIITTNGNNLGANEGVTLKTEMSTTSEYIFEATATEASITFYNGTYNYVKTISVNSVVPPVTVTVSSVGYATFSSDKSLDFTSAEKIKAYTAKIDGNTVNFTRIYQVPANTGVLLWASGGATEDIPVIESADPVNNDFKVAPYDMYKSDLSEGGTTYVLGNGGDGIGFYLLAEGFKVPKGKCYLQIPEEYDARIFIMPGMEDTGISATQVNNKATKSGIYNLNGQRIGKLQKGLNIVGGKKVIVK